MAVSLDVVKVLILTGLLVMTFIFGMMPVLFIRYIEKASESRQTTVEEEKRKKSFSTYWRLLSFLNCFAAGVFLATCLLELLPSVRHNLTKALFASNIYTGFPLGEFITVIGLFFILIIEQIALNVKENSASNVTEKKDSTENDIRQPLLVKYENDVKEGQTTDERISSIRDDHFLGGLSDEPCLTESVESENSLEDYSYNSDENDELYSIPPASHATNSSVLDTASGSSYVPSNSHSRAQSPSCTGRSRPKSSLQHNLHRHSVFRSMFLLCALSLHAIFEGLTLGLQTEISETLSIFAALVIHKSILSFSLGMNLMQSKISVKSAIKSIILFSVAAPIGVLIGMGIMDLWNTTNSGLVHGILQGFASGTFLYIIFFEVLPKEFNNNSDRLLKVLYLIIGYSVITGILFLGDDVKHPFCLVNKGDVHP